MTKPQQPRARLSIDVTREARRRVHIAAAKRDQSIRDYVWEAVEARLKHDRALHAIERGTQWLSTVNSL